MAGGSARGERDSSGSWKKPPSGTNGPAACWTVCSAQPGRVVLLLDGLDEIFDVPTREAVVNDIHRFSSEYAHTPILVTSRVVGYQPQRLRRR